MNSSDVGAHRSYYIIGLHGANASWRWGRGNVTEGPAPTRSLASRFLKGSPATFVTSARLLQLLKALAASSLAQRN